MEVCFVVSIFVFYFILFIIFIYFILLLFISFFFSICFVVFLFGHFGLFVPAPLPYCHDNSSSIVKSVNKVLLCCISSHIFSLILALCSSVWILESTYKIPQKSFYSKFSLFKSSLHPARGSNSQPRDRVTCSSGWASQEPPESFLIAVLLTYNTILVLGVQHSDLIFMYIMMWLLW